VNSVNSVVKKIRTEQKQNDSSLSNLSL